MESTRPNILLMGMPLSGKSTIAKHLAEKIGYIHFDLDNLIEEELNVSILDFFNNSGEEKFRLHERDILTKHQCEADYVISIGGGAVNKNTAEIIDLYKYKVWLKASVDELVARYNGIDDERPLLYNTNNIREKLDTLLINREPYYIRHSNIAIDTDYKSIDTIIEEIIAKIDE